MTEGRKIGAYLTADRLSAMSEGIGISVPVIVGILQHKKLLEWRQFARYRETVMDKIPEEYKRG